MDIEQAKRIPLADILHILNFKQKQLETCIPEHVSDLIKNGDTIGFVCWYLTTQGTNHAVSDALRWIRNMFGYAAKIQPIKTLDIPQCTKHLFLKDSDHLECLGLKRLVEGKGISAELACEHLKEIRIFNTRSRLSFVAVGLINQSGGFEASNLHFDGCIGKQDISFIRGTIPKPDGLHIFYDKWDYLSAVMNVKDSRFQNDSLLINSYSRLSMATPFIKGYGYKSVFSWMDNTKLGMSATQSLDAFLKTEDNLAHHKKNNIYAPFRNISEWHQYRLKLSQ